jgi:hypothetical protein
MKKLIIVAVTALAFLLLHLSCNQTEQTEKTTNAKTNAQVIKKVSQKKPKIEPQKEIITITFPKAENPTSPIPQKPLSDKEMQNFLQFIKSFNADGDGWYTFGGSLEQFPPDLDGSPQAECLELSAEEKNYCTWYTISEWEIGKVFAQLITYNYKLGDQKIAGQVAWGLDENVPWAKFLVAAWAEYFISKYEKFDFDHKLKSQTGWSDTVTTKNGRREYEFERQRTDITIAPLRNEKGLLVLSYQCIVDPLDSEDKICPWVEFSDENVERKLDGLDRAIFYLGPKGTKKAIHLLTDVSDILSNHPEKKIAIK